MNWIIKEAQNADPRKDKILLENPEIKEVLDTLLMERFYPAIIRQLNETDLAYEPITIEDTHIDSIWTKRELGRNLPFFLYGHGNYPILRGDITVFKTGYMFDRTFSIGLPKETEPDVLFRILSDPHFSDMPPALGIYELEIIPEKKLYFHISLKTVSGYDFGFFSLYNTAIHLIEETIKDCVEMYELSMIKGFLSMEVIETFLQIAYRCFEVC